jgi:hypothetical protein
MFQGEWQLSVQVDHRGNGTAMFASQDDMDEAMKDVDGSEMKNMRGTCIIRVDPLESGHGGGRDRDRSIDRRSRFAPLYSLCTSLHFSYWYSGRCIARNTIVAHV